MRYFLYILLACFIVLMSLPQAVRAERPPNIIFILADDLGYGELGSYGQEKIRTPHIDRLAAEGMRFTSFYTGAPVCAPARAVLLTGKHGGFASIRDNTVVQPFGEKPIGADEVTIARLLKQQGYATACIGKWGLGPPGSTGDPNAHGFDLFFGYNCQRAAHSYYPNHLFRNRETIKLPENAGVPEHYMRVRDQMPLKPGDDGFYEQFKGETYSHDLLIDEALAFVREKRDEPFFLYYAALLPHVGLQVPDEDIAPYLAMGWEEEPYDGGYYYVPHEHPRAAYAAMITRLDREVGQIMALLAELGLDDNTLVIFTSDNGPTFLDQVDAAFFNSAAGLRGLKGSVYEGGIRVPMIARWPGRIEAGTISDHAAYLPDVMPTFMDILDAADDVPDDVNGISFAPTLFNRPDDQKQHEAMVWEYHGQRGQQAVRLGDWKGVRQNLRQGNTTIELYNIADDPRESRNVADEHPQIVAQIEKAMREQRSVNPDFPMPVLDE